MQSTRLAATGGAGYVLASLIGNSLAETGAGGRQDGAGILADLQRDSSAVQTVGVGLEVLGTAALLVFLGYLYRVLRRAEGPDGWWAATALGAGLVALAVKLSSAAPFMAAQLRRDELTPELARTLIDQNAAGFVLSGYTTGLFVLAAAAASLSGRVAPRWLALSGVVVGALAVAAGTAGVLAPHGYVPVPFLLCLLWILVTSLTLAIGGPRHPDRVHAGADAVPAGDAGTA